MKHLTELYVGIGAIFFLFSWSQTSNFQESLLDGIIWPVTAYYYAVEKHNMSDIELN